MQWVLLVLRWAGVAVTLAAIAAQLGTLADAGHLDAVNFFSYFTIQSNLVGVVALAASAIHRGRRSRWLDWLRGAAAVYLTVTFLVVLALLQDVDVSLQLPWVDFVLHKLMPVVVVADYLLDPPHAALSVRDAAGWLIYPLVWLGYTMARGAVVGWYPYPFLDPANGGYGPVVITSAAVLGGGALLCLGYRWLGNTRASDTRRSTGSG